MQKIPYFLQCLWRNFRQFIDRDRAESDHCSYDVERLFDRFVFNDPFTDSFKSLEQFYAERVYQINCRLQHNNDGVEDLFKYSRFPDISRGVIDQHPDGFENLGDACEERIHHLQHTAYS